jgi:hypothetical protein
LRKRRIEEENRLLVAFKAGATNPPPPRIESGTGNISIAPKGEGKGEGKGGKKGRKGKWYWT